VSEEFPLVAAWRKVETQWAMVASINAYESLTFEPRWNDPGTFELTLPYETAVANVKPDCLITVDWRGKRTTWVLDRFNPHSNEQGTRTLTIGGASALSMLGHEIAWPDPTQPLGSQPDPELDPDAGRISGNAETVVRTLIEGNYVTRRGGTLDLGTNGNQGNAITARGQWDNLLELVTTKAKAGGISVDINLVGTSATRADLELQVSSPSDRSLAVRLSERVGTLTSWSSTLAAPTATRAIVGSAVGGSGRLYETVDAPGAADAAAQWAGGHRVVFVNGPSSYDVADLQAAGTEALLEGVPVNNVSLTAADSEGLQAFTHYNVGDKVTGQLEVGVDVVDIISSISVRVEDGYPEVVPTFGDPSAEDPMVALAELVRAMARRVRHIEQRGS
jgi:hypothetical protein